MSDMEEGVVSEVREGKFLAVCPWRCYKGGKIDPDADGYFVELDGHRMQTYKDAIEDEKRRKTGFKVTEPHTGSARLLVTKNRGELHTYHFGCNLRDNNYSDSSDSDWLPCVVHNGRHPGERNWDNS